jgi:uncharacterized membrane protein
VKFWIATALLSLLSACGQTGEASPDPTNSAVNLAVPPVRGAQDQDPPGGRWDLNSSSEGATLTLTASGRVAVRFLCPPRTNRLLINVPGFRPVGSEERLSFGNGGEVGALVADPGGDTQRGGVTGAGEVPVNLAALIDGPLTVNYGAQTSGPHVAMPAASARSFVAACGEPPRSASRRAPRVIGACSMQGSERLHRPPLRAIGTEPFWGARIEGRCVTYSHPDDQAGTRVWTRYRPAPNGGTWSGALGGQRFELRTRAAPGCSDGMSDRRYPIAVDLLVGGQRRQGCAEPL